MDIEIWILSFLLYSILRIPDVESTRLALAKLDPELHEMNEIVTFLFKKVGFKKTMITTWLLFASGIAFLDTYIFYPMIGFPVLWLILGIFHLMAAANNYQLHFQTEIIGAEAIEENTKCLIAMLKKLSPWRKVIFLTRWNFVNIFLALYGVFALVLTYFLLSAMNISLTGPIPYLLLVTPPIMIFDLIMFFPTIVFGNLIITRRRLKLLNDKDTNSEENQKYLTVSVGCLEKALNEAKTNSAEYVRFLIPHDE